jgi:hypothetical protein
VPAGLVSKKNSRGSRHNSGRRDRRGTGLDPPRRCALGRARERWMRRLLVAIPRPENRKTAP